MAKKPKPNQNKTTKEPTTGRMGTSVLRLATVRGPQDAGAARHQDTCTPVLQSSQTWYTACSHG